MSKVSDMPRKEWLFWDTDPQSVDPQKNAEYVIERIMDYGEDDDVRWMWHFYPAYLLRSVLEHSRVIHDKSKSLWEALLTTSR
jgi:hypothetical protein